jgi:fatty acid desaturase
MTETKDEEFTFDDIRSHRTKESGWVGIHGKVYDITSFIDRHPGGSVILTALGRDATILFETHHNLIENIEGVHKILAKYQIGIIKDYKPVAKFDSPFALKMLERVREHCKNKPHRDSFYSYSALAFFYLSFAGLITAAFYTGSLWLCPLLGAIMSVGHLAGHAGNHWSLSSIDSVNKFVSMTCTSMWGLREKYWEFSHLISHHCYNYTERDYIMEQHVPLKYFRIRESEAWAPVHAYQHYTYLTTPITAFFLGGLRLDCAPWILFGPLLAGLRRNKDSMVPAPQFFASGSNVDEKVLTQRDDGVGPENFVVFDGPFDTAVSIFLSNIIWLPLFLHTWVHFGLMRAVLLNSMSFGFQAALITRSLLQQHLCEHIKLESQYTPDADWYSLQVEASTSVYKNAFQMWGTFAISFQTEHHMFPSLNPKLLLEIQPIVEKTAKEFKLQYNFLESDYAATQSVYKLFKKLSVKPVGGKSL